MFGLKPMEFILMGGFFLVSTAVTIGVIYIAVRLALRHDRKNSK